MIHPTGTYGRKPETALMAYIRHALAGVHGPVNPTKRRIYLLSSLKLSSSFRAQSSLHYHFDTQAKRVREHFFSGKKSNYNQTVFNTFMEEKF